jgi:hypothetical protein
MNLLTVLHPILAVVTLYREVLDASVDKLSKFMRFFEIVLTFIYMGAVIQTINSYHVSENYELNHLLDG